MQEHQLHREGTIYGFYKLHHDLSPGLKTKRQVFNYCRCFKLTHSLRNKKYIHTRLRTNNMPVTWCSSASHSKEAHCPGTMYRLASSELMPSSVCIMMKKSGVHLVFLKRL